MDNNTRKQEWAKIRKKAENKKRICLYADCNKDAIKSHVLQKNGILREIGEDNHLIQFSFPQPFHIEKQGLYSFESIGINNVYTFLGFCSYHDTELFKPIETTSDLDLFCIEAQYLFSYRTLCQELRKKEIIFDISKGMIDHFPTENVDNFVEFKNGLKDGINNLLFFKNELDIDIESKSFNKFSFETLEIPKLDICISGPLNIEDENNPQSILFRNDHLPFTTSIINVFPTNNHSYVIAGYHNEYKDYWLNDFILRIKGGEKTEIFKELSDLISTRIEFWCISPKLFKSLLKDKIEYLKKIWEQEVLNFSHEIDVDFNLFT